MSCLIGQTLLYKQGLLNLIRIIDILTNKIDAILQNKMVDWNLLPQRLIWEVAVPLTAVIVLTMAARMLS